MKVKFKNRLSTTQIIAGSFLITILIGSILLKLPISRNENISYLDALFTATSATCVTGHSTVDVESVFTIFGQVIIMILIQIGGLGFMLVVALFLMWFGKKISLKNRMLISQSVSKNDFEGTIKLLRKIIKYTFTFELFGALILATSIVPELGFKEGLFKALFHSISAFCNAGFDIFKGESLMPYMLNKPVNITLIFLIQIGGLGFLVWDDISNCIGNVIRNRTCFTRAIKKFSLHTKLVLITQVILVLLGILVFMIFEYDNIGTIGNLTFGDKLLVSAFQSVSARTAGMFTIRIDLLTDSTKFFMIFLMLVGGAPGSMAGGLKTITLVVILFGMLSIVKGKKNISIGKKRIPHETYEKAAAVVSFMIIIAFIALIIVINNLIVPVPFLDVAFDVVSSIATVGLSTGAISNMNNIALVTNIILMYIGRVGTITTAVAFVYKKPKENDDIVYAKEDVIVG